MIHAFLRLSVFILLSREISSAAAKSTRSGRQLFNDDGLFDGSHDDVEFPPPEDPCHSMRQASPASGDVFLCLPLQRCSHLLRETSLPQFCGWSGLLPDVCCPVVDVVSGESASGSAGGVQTAPHLDVNSAVSPSAPQRAQVTTATVRTVTDATGGVQQVAQTMAGYSGETSVTKESISSITGPPAPAPAAATTSIRWTVDAIVTAAAASAGRPSASIDASDKGNAALTVTSTVESLASSTRGPSFAESNADPVKTTAKTAAIQVKKETPKPVIAYKNSRDCGFSDEHSVWPFLVSQACVFVSLLVCVRRACYPLRLALTLARRSRTSCTCLSHCFCAAVLRCRCRPRVERQVSHTHSLSLTDDHCRNPALH